MIKKNSIIITICILFWWNNHARQIKSNPVIKIGLLIANNESKAARNGALLAIDNANSEKETNGLHFQLLVRSMEGPWGTGSKEAVNLVFNEKVWAILGSHDGRNAHLVEQVIAKTHIVFLSAWASDPTLYQAFVPWFFSCVPNDLQQANILINEIYNKKKRNKITVVSDKSYDANAALQSFLKETRKAGKVEPMQLFYDGSNTDSQYLFDKIKESDTECIVLFGQPSASLTFLQQLRKNKLNLEVYGTVSLFAKDRADAMELSQYSPITFVSSGNLLKTKESSFKREYYKKYGKMPGAIAAYAFDGMSLIIEAVRHSGFDREKMQEAMANSHYNGITGRIEFDKNGNRIDTSELIEIKNEIPARVEK
jgi:ABC-type branched-subunit amino acid transport system substrate-binding protein